VTGILGGIGAELVNLMFLKQTADRLLGRKEYHWSAIGAGRMQMPICATKALMGNGCRVGLEDNLYIEKNVLAKSSSEQFQKIIEILKVFSLEAASPSEARKILGLR
jgi:3,5-dioxohexanoate:acetyl-CoA acetone transferase